jgi:hypothetical protein
MINMEKSVVMFGPNTTQSKREEVMSTLHIPKVEGNIK